MHLEGNKSHRYLAQTKEADVDAVILPCLPAIVTKIFSHGLVVCLARCQSSGGNAHTHTHTYVYSVCM